MMLDPERLEVYQVALDFLVLPHDLTMLLKLANALEQG
jgi:hypothetical protein